MALKIIHSYIVLLYGKWDFFWCGTGSGCNSATRTFHGVDVMGRRLAEEASY
jgi:hypothetical protein